MACARIDLLRRAPLFTVANYACDSMEWAASQSHCPQIALLYHLKVLVPSREVWGGLRVRPLEKKQRQSARAQIQMLHAIGTRSHVQECLEACLNYRVSMFEPAVMS